MVIREMMDTDYPSICTLIHNELGYPDVTIGDFSLRMDLMSQDDNYHTFVAVVDDRVVGFIGTVRGITYEMRGYYIRILALAVSEEHQNGGIGSALIKCVDDYAGSRGITAIKLTSDLKRLSAHAFYEHNGFVRTSYGFRKDVCVLSEL